MKKIFTMLMAVCLCAIAAMAAPVNSGVISNAKYEITPEGEKILNSNAAKAKAAFQRGETGANIIRHSMTGTNGETWYFQVQLTDEKICDMVRFTDPYTGEPIKYGFDRLPYYVANFSLAKEYSEEGICKLSTFVTFTACWPSYYIYDQIFTYEGELDSEGDIPENKRNYNPVSLTDLANNPDFTNNFMESYAIGSDVIDGTNKFKYWNILANSLNDNGGKCIVDGQECQTIISGNTGSKIVFNSYEPQTRNINAQFQIYYSQLESESNRTFRLSYDGIADVSGFKEEDVTHVPGGETLYLIGSDVNGHSWEMEQEDCKLIYRGNGIYEWWGDTLASGFKINDGTWENENFNIGSNGELLTLGETYWYNAYWNTTNILFSDCDKVINPHVILNLNDETILVEGKKGYMYENPEDFTFYVIGSNVNGQSWELAQPDALFTYVGNGLYEWKGDELSADFKINNGSWNNENYIIGSYGDFLTLGQRYHFNIGGIESITINGMTGQNLKNPKIVLNWDEKWIIVTSEDNIYPENPDPLYHSIEISVNNGSRFSFKGDAGHIVEFKLTPDEYWEIASLVINDRVITDVDDWTTARITLDKDYTLAYELAYAGTLEFMDENVGVAELGGSNVVVTRTNTGVVISGLTEGDAIAVYDMAGRVIGTYNAASESLEIRLDSGNTYIIRVNANAVKVLL